MGKNSQERTVTESNACLEINSAALEIQEYLQAYVRDLRWKIADQHMAEDSWVFFRLLERDELLSSTKIDTDTAHVTWTSGKVFVRVGTEELKDGFTRVRILARFRGYGRSSDQFAPLKEYWPLVSSGALESQLLSALEAHYKSLH